jgi:hypothetical protein
MKSRTLKNLLKIKKRLDKKTLRDPKTRPQKIDRINWDRVSTILHRRYDY